MIYKQIAPLILNALKSANHPLLIAHENPDGDTLGASLALAQHLESEAKNYQLFCIDQPAPYFNFLPKIEKLTSDYNLIALKNHDLIIAIDCGSLARTGLANDLLKIKNEIPLINIDHHQGNELFGRFNLVIPTASSTSEIMYNFFNFHNLKIDKFIATSLLTGILDDTMNFTNAATTTESLKIASELLNLGARANQIINYLTQNKNLPSLKLWGEILSRTETNNQYNFAYTYIKQKDFIENKIEMEAIDGIANFLSNLQDLDFIMVLTEENDGYIKGSLRTTKENIDVSQLAKSLGGGGHKKAAGFKLAKPQTNSDWKNFVLNAIITKLRTLN